MMCITKLLAWIANLFVYAAPALWKFLGSEFWAALFGALAGAIAANTIAVRSEERKRLRNEIAGVNASVALANAITNVFVSMKCQHVGGMVALYKRGFDRFLAVLITPPAQPTVFEFMNDFRELDAPFTPTAELRQILLDRVQSYGAALSVAVVLQQCIVSFANLIEARQRSIERIKLLTSDEEKAAIYFGLRNRGGHIDERYADQMSGLHTMTDNCIYFSMLLCDMLSAHGETIKMQLGRDGPKVSKIVYGPFEPGLLPNPAEFPDFEKNFRPKAENK